MWQDFGEEEESPPEKKLVLSVLRHIQEVPVCVCVCVCVCVGRGGGGGGGG